MLKLEEEALAVFVAVPQTSEVLAGLVFVVQPVVVGIVVAVQPVVGAVPMGIPG
jgi:hypothetical protein